MTATWHYVTFTVSILIYSDKQGPEMIVWYYVTSVLNSHPVKLSILSMGTSQHAERSDYLERVSSSQRWADV